MKLFPKFLCLVLLSTLAGCGPLQPEYRTDYHIVPPRTQVGQMCANNCLMAQQNCRQSCQLQHQICVQNDWLSQQHAGDEADRDYRHYMAQRLAQGKLIKRERSSFYRYTPDSDCEAERCENQCVSDYHICHSNCGGKVIPSTYCVANCQPAGTVPQ